MTQEQKYLFGFGYETPEQRKANERNGWDDESSFMFWVIADSPEAAAEWGREVAERLVHELFTHSGWAGQAPSWKEGMFADWIEEQPEEEFSSAELRHRPVVRAGEMSDDVQWLVRANGIS